MSVKKTEFSSAVPLILPAAMSRHLTSLSISQTDGNPPPRGISVANILSRGQVSTPLHELIAALVFDRHKIQVMVLAEGRGEQQQVTDRQGCRPCYG